MESLLIFLIFCVPPNKKNFPPFYRISLASNQEGEIKAMNMEQNSLRNRYDACLIPNIFHEGRLPQVI